MSRKTIYNDNLTSEWVNVSENNKALVEEYISYCHANDKSSQTVYQYEEWLKVFFCWNHIHNGDKFFIDLKKRDFVRYIGYLRDMGASPNRIASLKSVLSSLSNEIELMYEDLYPNFHNQLRGLESVHITTVREKTVLSEDKIDEILTTLLDQKQYQLACYLALLCSSGCRKSEMIQMQTNFFIPENEVFGGYMYQTPVIRSKGRGKLGKRIQKYVIKPSFQMFLDKWIEERSALGIDCEYLFVRKEGDKYLPATITTANSFARQISSQFNIEFYNHACRHYFCTLLKSMSLPDDVITMIFSWASTDMVKTYDDTPKSEKLNKWFGADGVIKPEK